MTRPRIDVVIPAYNAAQHLVKTLYYLLPHARGLSANIILVDDGSTDGTADIARRYADVRVVDMTRNCGRAAACNAGAAAGIGEQIVFLDADCFFARKRGLAAHGRALAQDAEVTVGPLFPVGEGFWGKYQQEVVARRQESFKGNDQAAMTSASLGIWRHWFERVNGFDLAFCRYGFEDRDLFLRLADRGARITLVPEAAVIHHADLHLTDICRKMRVAGATTGPLFRNRHPAAYARMDFSRADVSHGGWWRRSLAKLIRPVVPSTIAVLNPLLEVRFIPYKLRRSCVRALIGASYLLGTMDAESSAGRAAKAQANCLDPTNEPENSSDGNNL